MYYHKNVYFGKNIKCDNHILDKLNKGKMAGFHSAVVFMNKGEHLEIIDTALLIQKYMRNIDIEIVALLGSKEEAMEYITRIATISVEKYGEYDARKCIDELEERDLVG